MSLLSRGHSTHQVTVVLREMQVGKHGRLVPVETGRVECWGRIQPATTEDIAGLASAGETQVLNMKNFFCRFFPGDDISQVIDHTGTIYNVVGEPQRHRSSRRTSRDVVKLKQTSVNRG